MLPKLKQHWLGVTLGLLLSTGGGLYLHDRTMAKGLTHSSYDLLLTVRGERPAPEAVLVYLDEKSYEELGQPKNIPLDRALHARLIDRLTAAGARAIVFDVVFSDPAVQGPEADATLAAAMKRSGRVILAADKVQPELNRAEIKPPIDLLLEAAAAVGSADVEPDADSVVRRHSSFDPAYFPSLSWAVADLVHAPVTTETNRTPSERWMNYYGSAIFLNWTLYYQALDPTLTPDSFFRDRVVFVGARFITKLASQRKDEYANPFTFWSNREVQKERGGLFMPGVEIQATAFLNLLRHDWLTRSSPWAEKTALLLVGLLAGAGLVLLRPLLATTIGLLAMGLVGAGCYTLFSTQLIWSPWLLFELQLALALAWSLVFNSVQLYVQKRLVEQTLSLYLPPKLVKKFARNPKLLKPGAEKHLLTILFTDLANFTSLSEGVDSDELARFMNSYFQQAVSQCIHRTDGTVVKYIGDAIFAFWNAPDEQADHQCRACEAALLFRELPIQHIHGQPLYTRLGLHTGVANVGNFGSTERVDYTALGENINLASRMEGLNKYLGTQVLLTGETRAGLGDHFILRNLGRFRLKGFDRAVDAFELLGRAGDPDHTGPWREAFAQALAHFQKRDFEMARTALHQVLQLRPEDGPATFYLARIEELRGQTLPVDWKGDVELKEK